MKLRWYGHSCFLVETAEGSALLDPYAPGSVPGLALPPLTADLVLCSHGHADHGYRRGASLSGRPCGIRVETLETFHDEKGGALRGPNTVHILEAEGLRLVHLGDLGHMLSPEQIAALGKVDILLIPVGGHYTIDAKTADCVAKAIGARLTVPMHYRGAGFGYDVIGPVEDFLALRERIVRLDSAAFDPDAIEGEATVVLSCPT